MNTLFKRKQKVILLVDPDPEYVEYNDEYDDEEKHHIPIKKGMLGRINILLPNGKYHVEILDPKNKDEVIAYVPLSEENLKAAD